jgi:hypothetical protein
MEANLKLQNIPLDQIVSNPWRDEDLYPLDDDHIKELGESIKDHGFFASVKGRRVNGKIEIACGHARVAAARKAGIDTIPIFIDDLDDDAMLHLMTDENATQAGSSPGAVLNEVAAVTRRLIAGLLSGSTIVEPTVVKAFENKAGIEQARKKLRGANANMAIGENIIRSYLGDGKPDRCHRGIRQIREAISALKQSGRYDEIVDKGVREHPLPVIDAKPAKDSAVTTTKPAKPRRRILDERTAGVFKNDHQFQAFRQAVTTHAAQKVIPVSEQLGIAKEIMSEITSSGHKKAGEFNKKQVGAPYIKAKVETRIQEGMKEQRKIDKEERDRYLLEQIDAQIDDVVGRVNSNLRGLVAALMDAEQLVGQYPGHPKLGGLVPRLDQFVSVVKQFSRKL